MHINQTPSLINQTNQKVIHARIHGDVVVVLPDSLDLITSYVVQEQEDWFEDEIKFVRELMQPGMRVIDVGANYGLYALSMASKVGAHGHVWAFEPASSTVSFLKRSVALNNFSNVTVIQCALSNRTGTAKLGLNQNSELNTLCLENGSTLETEDVALTTLDRYTAEHGCEQIEFVKLDAEGEESNIVSGGAAFLEKESPLIMYELKHGWQVNLSLVRQFEERGYLPYILIPGLSLLAPFDSTASPDPFQLNLFCCKKDRARQLEQRGLLAVSMEDIDMLYESDALSWRRFLESKPFARSIVERWGNRVNEQPMPGWKNLKKAIEQYSMAHNPDLNPNLRYSALKSSYNQLAMLCNESPSLGRLCTFARVSRELGYREKALEVLRNAVDMRQQPLTLDEPFLPASHRFDSIDPGNRVGAWMTASLLEQIETCKAQSSFYSGTSSLNYLKVLLSTGFASPEMERRRQLILKRYGRQSGLN